MLGIVSCIGSAAQGGRVWWVAPSYKQALEGWTYLLRLVMQWPGVGISKTELTVGFPGGGSIQVRTGDNPEMLRGSGLDGIVLDEAATMKPEVWELVLRPALADKQGWAMFISTPQHFNWFWDLYSRAEQGATDWACWQHPTWDNPYIPEDEIKAAQRDMEPEDFDQEFGASFTAVGGAVFRHLSADRPFFLRPMPADLDFRRTGVGMDWGTTQAHQSAVVCGSRTSGGSVWIRSSWLDVSGSDNLWVAEAERAKRDHGATFARYDRSQGSVADRLKAKGLEADKGVADVSARIGALGGLMHPRRNIFFDVNGPGVIQLYNHLCGYHRDRDGKIVEEEDDDVDALGYLVSELVTPRIELPKTWPHRRAATRSREYNPI